MSNNNVINGKKNNNGLKIFLIICLILTIYLILRISYALNYDSSRNIFNACIDRILNPFPFKLTFNYYSLSVFMVWLLVYALVIKEQAKPKADSKWMGKEHGSNDFYTKGEVEDFIQKKTDPIIAFSSDEIKDIEMYSINNKVKV